MTRSSQSWLDIIWTSPERVLPGFQKACQFEEVAHEDILDDVDYFAQSLINASEKRYIFVASWHLPAKTGYGMLDWKNGLGLSNLLAKCNIRLAEKISESNNIFMLPTNIWMEGMKNPLSNKMWYAAKIPYVNGVFENAAKHIVQYIDAIRGKSRRLIVLDLDNTLWGEVVGENGWQGIRLGGHDHVGEGFKDFQLALKSLSNRGVQLAISSKNDEVVAMQAIDNHPEMILKREDFVGWRINWHDKASNIMDLADEINLGLESLVFIDDNPAERNRVSGALPEVLVPEWPEDPSMYVEALNSLCCFENTTITKEDRVRTSLYVSERNRQEIKHSVKNNDDWLRRLNTRVTACPVNSNNISRVTQLFNKTNQLNLSTRRLSEKEILTWLDSKACHMMAISVIDKFGDMGLVGVIGVEALGRKGRLVDFILSCRVMGRQVEQTLLHLAVSELVSRGVENMEIVYEATERNGPTLQLLKSAGLEEVNPWVFKINCEIGYEKPEFVELNVLGE
ncbi:HAD-IIIC family phosphatase [Amylibacter sp.]|nr:HAD-IIIC family phosphatase [Amylibacter sp.]